MKIYTKKGDGGETSLIGGSRVPKYHYRIEAYGTVDELNSHIGLLSCLEAGLPYLAELREIQDRLFTIGSLLAMEPGARMSLPPLLASDVERLEQWMDAQEQRLEPLRNFVLPGGHAANAQAHIARCVCRRAERGVVRLHAEEPQDELLIRYLNRLSDWLFVFARVMSLDTGGAEVAWTPRQA